MKNTAADRPVKGEMSFDELRLAVSDIKYHAKNLHDTLAEIDEHGISPEDIAKVEHYLRQIGEEYNAIAEEAADICARQPTTHDVSRNRFSDLRFMLARKGCSVATEHIKKEFIEEMSQ